MPTGGGEFMLPVTSIVFRWWVLININSKVKKHISMNIFFSLKKIFNRICQNQVLFASLIDI